MSQNIECEISLNDSETEETILHVYTDGACSNNGTEDAKAGIGIFFGVDDPRNLSEKISGKQTNNTAELSAIIKTFSIIANDLKDGKIILICTDSEYSIKCITSYGERNNKQGWKNDIPNKSLVKEIYTLFKTYPNAKFRHIRAHTGKQDIHSLGNEQADKLANKSINSDKCPYNSPPKIYLNIHYSKKDEIKKMGGKWDKQKKKWYIYENNPLKSSILSL